MRGFHKMAITVLAAEAEEESTYIVQCTFTDEDGNAVVPNSINWTLTDDDGTVINSREQVAVGSPASSIEVVLSGDDLLLSETEETYEAASRIFTIEATYDSDAGSDLPLKNSCQFVVRNLKYIT